MKKTYKATLLLSLLMSAAAYSADQVSMVYEPQTTDVTPSKLPIACNVRIVGVTDERNNKESVGTEFFPLLSGDPGPWVEAALDNLSAYGYKLIQKDQAKEEEVSIVVALTRAYVFPGSMRINGMVAMDAQFTLPSGEHVQRKYRASGSKANMGGAVGEYMSALNYAMNNVLNKVAIDLQNLCSGTSANTTNLTSVDK